MGGGNAERPRLDRHGRARSRHRARSRAGAPPPASVPEAAAPGAAAPVAAWNHAFPGRRIHERAAEPERSLVAGVSTAALVAAAAGLLGLGLVARWVSDPGPADATRPAASAQGAATQGAAGAPSRVVVDVPDSDCRRFVQTRQQFPTLTISVENACR